MLSLIAAGAVAVAAPFTALIRIGTIAMPLAAWMPGLPFRSLDKVLGSAWVPDPSRMKLAPVPSLTSVPTDFFTDDASTLTVVIRARPIISAEAVAAVRRGLREALVLDRTPTVPKSLRIGAPRPRTTGPAASGARMTTAISTSRAPTPTVCAPLEPVRAVPVNRIASPATPNASPSAPRWRSDRVGKT